MHSKFLYKVLIFFLFSLFNSQWINGEENPYEKILFSNNESLRNYFYEKYGWDKKNISNEDLDSYRKEYCEAFRLNQFHYQLVNKNSKLKDFCFKYLGINNENIKLENFDPIKQVNPKVKKKNILDFCKDAKDFEGCSKTLISGNKSEIDKESDELDFMGLPKLSNKDWFASRNKVKRFIDYYSLIPKKVKVRGIYGRYINYSRVYRFHRDGRSGTAPQIISSGSSYADCYDLGSNISCTGYGPSVTTIPGTPAISAGTRQIVYEVIIDCLDNTFYSISDKFGKSKWKKIEEKHSMTKVYRDKFCGKISSLEKSLFLDLAKGEPTEKDLKAKKELEGKIYD